MTHVVKKPAPSSQHLKQLGQQSWSQGLLLRRTRRFLPQRWPLRQPTEGWPSWIELGGIASNAYAKKRSLYSSAVLCGSGANNVRVVGVQTPQTFRLRCLTPTMSVYLLTC